MMAMFAATLVNVAVGNYNPKYGTSYTEKVNLPPPYKKGSLVEAGIAYKASYTAGTGGGGGGAIEVYGQYASQQSLSPSVSTVKGACEVAFKPNGTIEAKCGGSTAVTIVEVALCGTINFAKVELEVGTAIGFVGAAPWEGELKAVLGVLGLLSTEVPIMKWNAGGISWGG